MRRTVSHGPPSAAPEPPGRDLPRPSFVGREAELGQVQTAFEAAAAGQGSLVAVLGEPGIGKTSLCDQLAGYAASQGGRVLVGHCYEAAARPYLPFVEALRSYVLEREADALRHELGAGARDVARLLAEVCDRLGIDPSVSTSDGEDDRCRLLEAITEFLRVAAQNQPIVLVLEDLHDADHGTLDLLVHLARRLEGARLLVVGTYRDVEVERAHPLSAALAELRRSRSFVRVHLRGLSLDDVQRLLASTSQQAIPRPFAELVHRRADGNPLFAHELLRFVVEEGLVERRAGTLRRVGEGSIAPRIPEGLRDVVGKRLSRLSASTNQVLHVAAVIGREFPLEVLRRVHARAEEELEEALEEGLAAAIVEERSVAGAAVTYRFGHAFFRQTLYDEMIAPRRIRLHQQIARVLEELYARRLDEHAAELAEHYAFSSETADLVKAVHYGQLAARRATDVCAYSEAAYQLDRALQVQDLADPDDAARCCDLLLELGEAREWDKTWEALTEWGGARWRHG
jgi:predicted ATPase